MTWSVGQALANTDLDRQLRQRGIRHSTAHRDPAFGQYLRRAYSAPRNGTLGCHVTLVRDATAASTHEMMHTTHELNAQPTHTRS